MSSSEPLCLSSRSFSFPSDHLWNRFKSLLCYFSSTNISLCTVWLAYCVLEDAARICRVHSRREVVSNRVWWLQVESFRRPWVKRKDCYLSVVLQVLDGRAFMLPWWIRTLTHSWRCLLIVLVSETLKCLVWLICSQLVHFNLWLFANSIHPRPSLFVGGCFAHHANNIVVVSLDFCLCTNGCRLLCFFFKDDWITTHIFEFWFFYGIRLCSFWLSWLRSSWFLGCFEFYRSFYFNWFTILFYIIRLNLLSWW